ncbi:hypothetical protein ABH972_008054 [Bradyrhizobium ottawaense]
MLFLGAFEGIALALRVSLDLAFLKLELGALLRNRFLRPDAQLCRRQNTVERQTFCGGGNRRILQYANKLLPGVRNLLLQRCRRPEGSVALGYLAKQHCSCIDPFEHFIRGRWRVRNTGPHAHPCSGQFRLLQG